jgi:hypothetical protein
LSAALDPLQKVELSQAHSALAAASLRRRPSLIRVTVGRLTPTFQMAEVAVPRQMFAEILSLIARLQAPPAPA